MAITRDLEIRGRADFRQVEQAAKRAEAAQDKFTQKARAANQKAIQQGGVLAQKIKEQERARDRLAKLVERTERKEALFGRNREQRLRVEGRLLQQQARQAGATAAQIEKIGRAYDRMADKAARAARATGGGGSAFGVVRGGVGRLAGAAALAGGVLGAGSAVGGIAERSTRIAELSAAQNALARNTGVAREALAAEVREIERLDISTLSALESVSKIAGTGMPELISRADELAVAARNVSTVMGGTTTEAVERLTGAIVKEEVEILETAGLLVKFQQGYDKFAESVGKSSNQLTEQEKLLARFNQVMEAAGTLTGAYEEALSTSAGQAKLAAVEFERMKDSIAKLAEPAVAATFGALRSLMRAVREEAAEMGAAIRVASAAAGAVGQGRLPTDRAIADVLAQRGTADRTAAGLSPFSPRIVNGRVVTEFGAGVSSRVFGRNNTPGPPPPPPGRFRILESFQPARSGPRATTVSGGAGPGVGGVGPGVFGFRNYFSSGTSAGAAAGVLAATNDEAFAALQAGNNRRIEEEQRVQERIRRENERTFEDLKRQSADVFDALLLRGESVWNVFRNAGLTALRDIVSSQSAGALFALFGGRTPAGALGLPGGGLGGAGFGLAGLGPGGTAGFAGPVAGFAPAARVAAGSSRAGAAGAGFGSAAFGALGFGLGGGLLGAKVPGSGAVKGAAAAGLGFAGAFVGATAASGVGLGASVGLLGVALSNPFSAAAVGGIVGVGALIGALSGGARSKARKKIQDAYGVRIEDKGVLQQVVEIGKGLGGSLDAAVSSPAVRELVLTWAMATGQDRGSGLFPTVTETRLISRGGRLFQGPTYHNGRAAAFASGLPVADVDPRATLTTISPASQAARSPELTADAASRAFEASALRRETAALLLQPNVAVGA